MDTDAAAISGPHPLAPGLEAAFSLDMAQTAGAESKWPIERAIAFAGLCGAALWAVIASAFVLLS